MQTSLTNGSSEFVTHAECEECGSSDGKAIYSDHSYCFVCEAYQSTDGSITHTYTTNSRMTLQGHAQRLNKRNLSEKVCEKYKIYRDGNALRFHYYNANRQPVGAKLRTPDKDFRYEGESPGTFFGSQLWPTNGKRIVITEGELDAASVQEAMPGWPSVSLPNGAAAAKKSVQKNLELLQGYEEIVLFFDSDEVGQSAARDAAAVLPVGKVKIATIQGYKDANEALQNNDTDSISRAIWDARVYRPDGIVEAKTLLEVVTTPNPPSDHDYAYKGLQDKLHGIRYGELITITAGSGIGKSSFCRDLATNLLNTGASVGYLALEESNKRTALGLMSAEVGKPLHIGEHSHEDLTKAFDQSIANWNLFLFDGFGSYDPDVIYNRVEYLASGLDCKIIFLDHLSILMSGLEGDERRMIDQVMTRLRSLVEKTGIALFLVSHLRRPAGDQGHEDGAKTSLGQLRGSHSIAQLSDAVIGLERDQQNSNATTVRVLKNRYSGETGIACSLDYDLQTCTFTETQSEEEFDPLTDF